jgi:hypothetical protein
VDFCADVLPIFQYRCSGGPCHAIPAGNRLPAEGLLLQTADGVANTALHRVSQESNTGARAGQGFPAGRIFGVDMPIIDPPNPGNSWLMYKLLLARYRPIDQGLDAGAAACGADASLPGPELTASPSFTVPLSDDERTRLGTFVIGNQMPYSLNLADNQQTPSDDLSALPCTFEELERIRAWIAQGASVVACPACPE